MARSIYKPQDSVLPALVVGPADVNRSLLELQQLDDLLRQADIRKETSVKLPKTSRTIDSLAEANGVDLLNSDDREALITFMRSLQQQAPVLHISFAAEPSAAFTAQIVDWLRLNISQHVLVQVGLQPSIAAGCIVRSTNKVFDLSLRQHLKEKRPVMLDLMRQLREKPIAVTPAPVTSMVTGAKS